MAVATLMLTALTVQAVPAKPGVKKTVKQADGSTIELTLRGDEHYSFYTDAAGAPFQLVNGIAKRITPEEVTTTWTARKKANLDKTAGNNRRVNRIGDASASTTGTHKGLVILLQFKDVKFQDQDGVKDVYKRVFNESGYNEGGMAGSVRDYFLKQSYNQLTINFDVVGPYTTAFNLEKYGVPVKDKNEKVEQHDKDARLAMKEAVQKAIEDTSLDFSDYDWDGDGEIDQVFIIFAGYSEAQGADENCLWPHEWSLKDYNLKGKDKNGNDVAINTYGCASELMGKDGAVMDGIGTACHEFSHCLGLPDMYDTDYSGGFGMSYWDVMDSGSYLDDSRTPSGYTSYERWFSGWLEPVEINSMTRINNMKPLATHPEAYVLYNDAKEKSIKGEYYLLENRQPVDFDAKLYGHGMLILHVAYNEYDWSQNKVNDNPNQQQLSIIPADNNFSNSYSGLQGDPWPGRTGNTELTNYSTPAAILFNANVDGQKLMSKAIDNITENTTTHTISFVACRPELPIPNMEQATINEGTNSFSLTWPAVNGALGYEIELATMDKAATNPSEALQWQTEFEKCYSKSAGFSDISSKLSDYGLAGWGGSKLFTSPNKLKFGTSSVDGYLQTPSWWRVPSSQEMTFIMGAAPATNGTSIKGNLTFESIIENGTSADLVSENREFEVSGDGKQVFTFKVPKQNNLYRLKISPKGMMYMNHLSIYDGTWTAEQLGINSGAAAARRATTINTYTTTTNSYTFTGLDTNKRYTYRVRAIGEENTYSQWSEEKTFEFGGTGVVSVFSSEKESATRFFDLQGREVKTPTHGLYIRNGKKVVVK